MKLIALGAGDRFRTLLQRKFFAAHELVAVMDNAHEKQGKVLSNGDMTYVVQSLASLNAYDYDGILITVESMDIKRALREQLLSIGVPAEKILLPRNNRVVSWASLESDIFSYRAGNNAVYVDVSLVTEVDFATGVQRVVNELYANMRNCQELSMVPFQWVGKALTSREYEFRFNGGAYDGKEYGLHLKQGDKVLLLDSSYEVGNEILSWAKASNVSTYVVLYDLIPLRLPDAFGSGQVRKATEWISMALREADYFLCISKAVADEVVDYFREQKIVRTSPLIIHYFHLGFDIFAVKPDSSIRRELLDFVGCGETFLMVGTVEPRKNHFLVLKAFQKIWQISPERKIRLLIIGRDGWLNDDTKDLLEDEAVRGRVLWLKNATDAELCWAYQNVDALLNPSQMEGYGLPLAEAAHFNLPVLCSDIPVFHEILGDNADYFKANDEESLRETVLAWLEAAEHPDSTKANIYTWEESAKEVIDILMGRAKPYCVLS